jgi:hypothetical protein
MMNRAAIATAMKLCMWPITFDRCTSWWVGTFFNENLTGLAQTVGQLQGSNRDFQSKCWAKPRNLGQPCAIFVFALWHLLALEVEAKFQLETVA